MRKTMVAGAACVLALAGCGDSDSAGGVEEWCDLATELESTELAFDGLDAFSADGMAEIISTLDRAVDAAPGEIRDDVETVRDAMSALDGELSAADYNPLELDLDAIDEIGSTYDVDSASDAISAFNAGECGIDPDGGDTDGGESDSGETGTGDTDGGETDSGETDSGETDSGETDSGETDSGETDSGETDSGETDSGETDSGDSDSGDTDGGNPGIGLDDESISDIISSTLGDSLGLTDEQARCLADAIGSDLLDENGQPDMSGIFDALGECDISMADLAG